jgi:hypothetical protein
MNTLDRRRKNGDPPELIKAAKQALDNAEVEKDIEKCNVALKYGDISEEHKLSLTEYLKYLRSLLPVPVPVPVGGK